MSDHPKISIISTVYNTGPYLRPAVESILAQTFTDFELLLVDDGSTDGTPALLQEFAAEWPGRVAFAAHAPAFGNARDNFFWLMEQSRADYVLFCDQDDVWNPDKVEKTLAGLRQLEQGNVPLEASLKLFQEGTALVKSCTALLDSAEQEIVKLMKTADGTPAETEYVRDE